LRGLTVWPLESESGAANQSRRHCSLDEWPNQMKYVNSSTKKRGLSSSRCKCAQKRKSAASRSTSRFAPFHHGKRANADLIEESVRTQILLRGNGPVKNAYTNNPSGCRRRCCLPLLIYCDSASSRRVNRIANDGVSRAWSAVDKWPICPGLGAFVKAEHPAVRHDGSRMTRPTIRFQAELSG
jgi:hypothetical protein